MSGVKSETVGRAREIKSEMDKISRAILRRARALDADVMSVRSDPEIINLWNKLCYFHMQGMLLCLRTVLLEDSETLPKDCKHFFKPQACIRVLHLDEEETCCERILERLKETHRI